MKLPFKHQKFQADAAVKIFGSSSASNPTKISVGEIFKLLAPNTSVRVV